MIGTRVDDWMSRGGVIAVVRLVHGAFFLAVAAYCFLSYSPFAYAQFIKPSVVPALTDFVLISQWYMAVVVLATVLTLMPQLRGGRGRRLAIGYVVVWGAVAGVALYAQPLRSIGNSPSGFAVGLIALVAPVWLALVDHVGRPSEPPQSVRLPRVLMTCLGAAGVAWASYALAVPFRLAETVGIDLGRGAVAVALGASLVADLYVFTALFLALAVVIAVARPVRHPGRLEYWFFVALLGACASLVLYTLVCASIAFTGWDAAVASGAIGLTISAVWANLARLRSHGRSFDSLTLFSAPILGAGSRRVAWGLTFVLPLLAYGMVTSVSHLDWNFLLQKLTVLLVWLTAFALVSRLGPPEGALPAQFAGFGVGRTSIVPVLIFGLFHGFVSLDARYGERAGSYAALDPSYRLIRDARLARTAETAEYYAFLRANTLAPMGKVPVRDVDLVAPMEPAPGPLPDIYLIIVDSMRRDYLEPYNPRVTFTPQIARLARDSMVFDRAYTRYAGTSLAVASIWAGGMVPHALEQNAFASRNTLLKLLDANRYVRMMPVDHIIHDLVPPDEHVVQLARGKGTMDIDVCSTMTELEEQVERSDPSRPVFFYALPQDVHIAVASRRKVPAGESYPGFFAPVASSVHKIDGCIGGFVDFLKRTNRYDRSIVIVTSDHGDSLGEEGRWGHAYFLVPEVMRIPLIVHVPPALGSRLSVDLSALTFSSDLVPSLYTLMGYSPTVPGDFMGRSAFGPPDADSRWRRRDQFLVASSYGAVYGMLRRNGTLLYAVDAVEGRDNAFELVDDGVGKRVEITPALTTESRARIRDQINEFARQNRLRQRQ